MSDKTEDYSVTSLDYVVAEKAKVLEKLKENRDKHNMIYDAACSGYWIEAKKVLEEKAKEFGKSVERIETQFGAQHNLALQGVEAKDQKQGINLAVSFHYNYSWPLAYPSNHIEDYDRAINMLEYSIADKVRLPVSDFNAYVRNDWSWKQSFMGTNSAYITAVTGCTMPLASFSGFATLCSGMASF